MKYSVSIMFDPDLHAVAKAYADEKQISFARLVHETLCVALGREGRIDDDLKAKIEERIAKHPGRPALSAQVKAERALRRIQQKYPNATLGEPRDYTQNDEILVDGKWVKTEE